MPKIAKGGKYVYGWSKIGTSGRIAIPDEAIKEYKLKEETCLILMSGSRRSGGMSVSTVRLLQNSPLAPVVIEHPELGQFRITEGKTIAINQKIFCWVNFYDGNHMVVPLETLKCFDLKPGDSLLAIRSSNIAIGFPVKGPIIQEAKNHPDIEVFR